MTEICSFQGKTATKDGIKLFYRTDIPEQTRAIVVIVHGVAEHCGRYGYTTEYFNRQGYGVYRFDHRGHGQSGGSRGYIDHFLQYTQDTDLIVQLARQEYPDIPIFMLGHSMGGFIAAAYGIEYPDRLKGQILSGPAVIELPLPDIKLLKRLPYRLIPRLTAGNKLGSVVSRDPEVVHAYQTDEYNLKKTSLKMNAEMFLKGPVWMAENSCRYTLPCLIVHGGDDRIVTPKASEWLLEHIHSTDKRRKVYDGLYHEVLNEKERETVLADMCDWIGEHIS